MGSGSALVAKSKLSRRFIGYDLDPSYVEIARTRVAEEGAVEPSLLDEGLSATARCLAALETAGFELVATEKRIVNSAVVVGAVVTDMTGATFYVEIAGQSSA